MSALARVSCGFGALACAASATLVLQTAIASPFKGMSLAAYGTVFVLGATAVFLLLHLVQSSVQARGPRRLLALAKWIAAIGLPLPAIGAADVKLQENALRLADSGLAPVIAYLETHARPTIGELVTVLKAAKHVRRLAYAHDADGFVLSTEVPSLDGAGYTIFFHSENGRWQRFHNSELTQDSSPGALAIAHQTMVGNGSALFEREKRIKRWRCTAGCGENEAAMGPP